MPRPSIRWPVGCEGPQLWGNCPSPVVAPASQVPTTPAVPDLSAAHVYIVTLDEKGRIPLADAGRCHGWTAPMQLRVAPAAEGALVLTEVDGPAVPLGRKATLGTGQRLLIDVGFRRVLGSEPGDRVVLITESNRRRVWICSQQTALTALAALLADRVGTTKPPEVLSPPEPTTTFDPLPTPARRKDV